MERSFWQRHWMKIGAIGGALLVGVIYGFAVRLPFFFDDLVVLRWVDTHSWLDVLTSSENGGYYRPLTFLIYKAGLWLPVGMQQPALHGVNLFLHWAGAVLVMQLSYLGDAHRRRALLAGLLLIVFPFLIHSVPWVTALPHPLVTVLTLGAAVAALRAMDGAPGWWGVSLAGIVLAPLAHESGMVCGGLVAGLVLLQQGRAVRPRSLAVPAVGVLLNLGTIALRGAVLESEKVASLQHLGDFPQNLMYFLQGLAYPIAPWVELGVARGGHDFTLLGAGALLLGGLTLGLVRRSGEWRWAARGLWWWGCGALPAMLFLDYGSLGVAPRLYSLASVGIVLFWVGLGAALAGNGRKARGVVGLLTAALLVQNGIYLARESRLYALLDGVYRSALQVAAEEPGAGLVNLPAWLNWTSRTYPLASDGVLFVPYYSSLDTFWEVNLGRDTADGIYCSPVMQETEPVMGFLEPRLDWTGMRAFALAHRGIWLSRYELPAERFVLRYVGALTSGSAAGSPAAVDYAGGPQLESAAVRAEGDGNWALTLTWRARDAVEAEIFVHVVDAQGALVAQGDGPALGGMLPLSFWQPGDRLVDVRYLRLSPGGSGPYTVRVGVYNAGGRLPARLSDGTRPPDDAAPVATLDSP